MFFRPTFCANCGEKIERAEWGLLTSRRFCQVCESQYKGHDLIPRAIVAGGLLAGIFGLGAYIKSSTVAGPALARQLKQPIAERPAETVPSPPPARVSEPQPAASPQAIAAVPSRKAADPRDVPAAPTYYCGARTKKGTACSRRVKGNQRCYQHAGMPAMAAAEELKVTQ